MPTRPIPAGISMEGKRVLVTGAASGIGKATAMVLADLDGERLHAMAHCAGILMGRPWHEDAGWYDRFHRMMDVNVRVPLEIAHAATEHMAAHGGGHIVLVGSVAGKTGGTSLSTPPDYSASKGAVHALVKWMSRNAVGRGVMVNAVAPGPVQTAMTRNSNMGPTLPLGRMGYAEELAWPIAFLCSAGASYMSGCKRRGFRWLMKVEEMRDEQGDRGE